jgi:hypothetical protein
MRHKAGVSQHMQCTLNPLDARPLSIEDKPLLDRTPSQKYNPYTPFMAGWSRASNQEYRMKKVALTFRIIIKTV